ncbi:Polymerase/histidinol phosphatase-like protein [Polychytrium aggregatum]|uniref:Polymerase/histidinol phosphatase-like protein n=1 Tax=Polychytrium aggregatum TaxID=110093 RepID=UPI0022FF07F2|nr:Polymerase/histidinol phosphatase-like protein [Polychytrium aggregatum]KAI9209898.1 Polymerase/histidinol phosphatase-like protein [Polychytrium aggregatum]
MVVSLHSHSGQFCLHAHGNLEDVVLKAIEKGFKVYGLSEHVPRSRAQDLYPEESHLTPQDTYNTFVEFYRTARHLQSKYESQIQLLVGLETEWIHSGTLSELQALVQAYPVDYMVGSVHHVNTVPIDYDTGLYAKAVEAAQQSSLEGLFRDYFDQQHSMLAALKPLVVGHFDLVRIFAPAGFELSAEVWDKIRRNVALIVEYGGLVELNSRAWKKGLRGAYPQADIIEYMKTQDVKFTLSDDSHGPNDVGMHYDKLMAYVHEMGLHGRIFYPERTAASSVVVARLDTAST